MYGKPFWYGKEVEGRLSNIETCFIRSSIPNDVLEYPHVYFTIEYIKDCISTSNWEYLLSLIDSKITITIESNQDTIDAIPIALFNRCHIIYRIKDSNVFRLKNHDTISIDADWYRVLQITKHSMLELKPENYIYDRVK